MTSHSRRHSSVVDQQKAQLELCSARDFAVQSRQRHWKSSGSDVSSASARARSVPTPRKKARKQFITNFEQGSTKAASQYSSAANWRLSTANATNANNTANVNSSGYVNNNNTTNANGVAPL